MTISEKVAYLKGLADGLAIDTEKSKEGKLINEIIGILEEIGYSIEDLEDSAAALGEEIDAISVTCQMWRKSCLMMNRTRMTISLR